MESYGQHHIRYKLVIDKVITEIHNLIVEGRYTANMRLNRDHSKYGTDGRILVSKHQNATQLNFWKKNNFFSFNVWLRNVDIQ
jgi:hypothetical protein